MKSEISAKQTKISRPKYSKKTYIYLLAKVLIMTLALNDLLQLFRLKLSQLFSFIMHLYFIVQLNSYYVDHENIPQVSLEKFDEDSTYWYDLPIYILFLWGCIYAFLLLWFVVTMYLCFKYMIFRFCNISCRIGEDSIIDVNE